MFSVLLLDSDAEVISTLHEKIRWNNLGINQVLEAENIEAARHMLRSEAIDIVISEIDLPDGSGLDLLQRIRHRHLPCEMIFLTNRQDFSTAQQALHAHAADYFLKPVDTAELEAVLRDMLVPLLERQAQADSSDIFPFFIKGDHTGRVPDIKIRSLQQKVDRFIELHYREPITRETIAESMFFSPVYLGKMYKRSAGITISDRLTQCRIAHARYLLANPIIPIAEISDDVGFASQAYFSTMFKKLMGVTPKEYRRYITDDPEKELP